MKTQSFIIPICSLLLAGPVLADVYVLKDGSRLEGSILREEGDHYILEVKVTKSIRDEKIIAKADVVSIEKERQDLNAFQTIKDLVPTPDMLGESAYAERIAAVEKFLKSYPNTPRTEDASRMLQTLKSEAEVIKAGGVKVHGAIIPVSGYKADAYDIDAERQAAEIRNAAAKFDYIKALRAYEVLEKEFKGSKAYVSSIPVVSQVLGSYEAQIQAAQKELPGRMKDQKAGLERMSGTDRANAEAGLKSQMDELDARYEQEKEQRQIWVMVDPSHKKSLDDAARAITITRSKINSYRPLEKADPGQAYRDLWKAIQGREKKVFTPALSAARTANVPARYIDPLAAEAKAIEVEQAAEAVKAKAAADAEKAAKKAADEAAAEAAEKTKSKKH